MINLKYVAWGVIAALLTFSHIYAINYGKGVILSRLSSDRIKVLKDGQAVDKEVLGADDTTLCGLLGGCELPDDKSQ